LGQVAIDHKQLEQKTPKKKTILQFSVLVDFVAVLCQNEENRPNQPEQEAYP